MKNTKLLSITSLLLIAAMLLAPVITAQVPGGIATSLGSTNGGTATTLGTTFGGLATTIGTFLGGLANTLGTVNGGLAQTIGEATEATTATPTTPPATETPPETTETPTTTPTETPPGTITPPPAIPPPSIPVPPGGFPTNVDAVWQQLSDITIPQGSDSGTTIQENIFSKCSDADDANLEFSIKTKSENYDLSYKGNDLKIFNLKQTYTGTETVTLTCNKVPASFKLTVTSDITSTSDQDELSVHINTIRLPESAAPGEQIPITITFKNNGDEKLEDLKAAVSIQELGIRASVGPMDLSVGKRVSKTIYVELPQDVQPGTYYAKITIDSSSLHRVKYREVIIA